MKYKQFSRAQLSKEAGCCPSVLYKPAQELEQERWMFIIFWRYGGGASELPCCMNCIVCCFDPESMKLCLDCEGFRHLNLKQC